MYLDPLDKEKTVDIGRETDHMSREMDDDKEPTTFSSKPKFLRSLIQIVAAAAAAAAATTAVITSKNSNKAFTFFPQSFSRK